MSDEKKRDDDLDELDSGGGDGNGDGFDDDLEEDEEDIPGMKEYFQSLEPNMARIDEKMLRSVLGMLVAERQARKSKKAPLFPVAASVLFGAIGLAAGQVVATSPAVEFVYYPVPAQYAQVSQANYKINYGEHNIHGVRLKSIGERDKI